jgi:hypothetical protein
MIRGAERVACMDILEIHTTFWLVKHLGEAEMRNAYRILVEKPKE